MLRTALPLVVYGALAVAAAVILTGQVTELGWLVSVSITLLINAAGNAWHLLLLLGAGLPRS